MNLICLNMLKYVWNTNFIIWIFLKKLSILFKFKHCEWSSYCFEVLYIVGILWTISCTSCFWEIIMCIMCLIAVYFVSVFEYFVSIAVYFVSVAGRSRGWAGQSEVKVSGIQGQGQRARGRDEPRPRTIQTPVRPDQSGESQGPSPNSVC